jgi:hypothetical protein
MVMSDHTSGLIAARIGFALYRAKRLAGARRRADAGEHGLVRAERHGL